MNILNLVSNESKFKPDIYLSEFKEFGMEYLNKYRTAIYVVHCSYDYIALSVALRGKFHSIFDEPSVVIVSLTTGNIRSIWYNNGSFTKLVDAVNHTV